MIEAGCRVRYTDAEVATIGRLFPGAAVEERLVRNRAVGGKGSVVAVEGDNLRVVWDHEDAILGGRLVPATSLRAA